MKNKEKFISCISTLLHSGGGDTPAEAVWAANELFEWAFDEFGIKLTPLNEEYPDFDKFKVELQSAPSV